MKIIKSLTTIFAILAICSAIYIIYTGGKISDGYAVIPLFLSAFFSQLTRVMKKQKK